jgi:hypothetical protein
MRRSALSLHGGDKHMRALWVKLRATSKAHAVDKGIRYGRITEEL